MRSLFPTAFWGCTGLCLSLIFACTEPPKQAESVTVANPAAMGFNVADSDVKAIEIADEVMKAMGGRDNWDRCRYLSWNFFGVRQLYWNRQTGDVRVESPRDSLTVLVNIKTKKGKARKDGEEITHPDSLARYLNIGYEIWVNDSYWLVMPFKLKDSGVQLNYIGQDTTETGQKAEVLELRFKEIGVTPENKYRVFIDQKDHLVRQWAFYPLATDSLPRFTTPWDNYQPFGKILLSSDRGKYTLSDIQVYDELPVSLFQAF